MPHAIIPVFAASSPHGISWHPTTEPGSLKSQSESVGYQLDSNPVWMHGRKGAPGVELFARGGGNTSLLLSLRFVALERGED